MTNNGVCVFLCEQAASKTKHSNVMKWELETGIRKKFHLVSYCEFLLLPFLPLSLFPYYCHCTYVLLCHFNILLAELRSKPK